MFKRLFARFFSKKPSIPMVEIGRLEPILQLMGIGRFQDLLEAVEKRAREKSISAEARLDQAERKLAELRSEEQKRIAEIKNEFLGLKSEQVFLQTKAENDLDLVNEVLKILLGM
jgi:hypothetical protein